MANDILLEPNTTPFEFTTFFAGRTTAWGIVEDRFGRVRRRFSVEMHGAWHDAVFQLDERFHHDTGEIELRRWTVTKHLEGRFTATCNDCIGQAKGESANGIIRMAYLFRLKLKRLTIHVKFDDRLYRLNASTAFNRATMRKFGIKIGELSLFMQSEDEVGPVREATTPPTP